MNKKISLSIVLIVIIVLALGTWFFQNQITDLQNQISELKAQNRDLQAENNNLQNQISELVNQTRDLQDQLGEFQNQTKSVKIKSFEWISGFNPYIALTLVNEVKVTIKNSGVTDVNGLTLTVKLMYNSTTELGDSKGFTKQIDTVNAGESLEIVGEVFSVVGNRPNGTACVSTLKLGDVVLDEWTRAIVW